VIRFVAGRLLQLVPLLWVVVTLVFVPLRLIPGDPATVLLGVEATEEQRAAFRQRLGLDAPVHVQYLRYLGRLAHGDLGRSISYREEVAVLIGRTLPATLELAAAALGLAMLVAVPLGVLAAVFRGGWLDWLSTLLAVTGAAVPGFWLGVMLILLFSVSLGWLPSTGRAGPPWTADGLRHLVLPAATLALALVASTTRLTRSAMLEVLGDDYVRTARAKGLREGRVVWVHALRNSVLPVLSILAVSMSRLFGGAVVTETIFALPGVGILLVDSILGRDFPVVQGIIIVVTVGVFVTNFLIEIAYAVVDPRVRYQ
jgi:peptide/nickel transport system permease protein